MDDRDPIWGCLMGDIMNDMPEAASDGPPPIRAFALVGETLREVYRHRRVLVKVSAIPAAVWVLLGFAQLYMVTHMLQNGFLKASVHGGESWLSTTFTVSDWFVNAILSSGLAIACHRLLLLRTMPKSALGFDFGWRELRYIGYGAVILIGVFAPVYFGVAFTGTILAILSHGHISPILALMGAGAFILAFIFAYMAFVRLSLVVPAIAVDAGAGIFARLKRAWRLSHPGHWRLAGAWTVILLIIGLVFIGPQLLGLYIYGFYGGFAVLAIVIALSHVIGVVVLAFMLSVAYRRLGGEIPDHATVEG